MSFNPKDYKIRFERALDQDAHMLQIIRYDQPDQKISVLCASGPNTWTWRSYDPGEAIPATLVLQYPLGGLLLEALSSQVADSADVAKELRGTLEVERGRLDKVLGDLLARVTR